MMELIPQSAITPIEGANSYLDLTSARAMATMYGYTLPADDEECKLALVKAWLYVDQREPRMNGERVGDVQNTAYPRANVEIRGRAVTDTTFPRELLLSQVVAASYHASGVDLTGGIDDGKSVASKDLSGVGSMSYFDNGKTGADVSIPEFDLTIAPLLSSSSFLNFQVSR